MVRQIELLTKAQLLNVWNINAVRYSRDRKKRAGMIAMAALRGLLVLMMAGYVGGAAYAYILLGMEDVLPMYLGMIAGVFIFFFGMFQAGSVIFQKNSYEVLCALPISQTAVVVSRFLVMYLGNLLLATAIMLPGMAVYGVMLRPALSFYVWGAVGTLFLPMLPMTVAVLFGAVITAVSSRMKHKSMVATLLSVLLVFGLMAMGSGLSVLEERGELTADLMRNFSGILSEAIASVYPPAVWLGQMMTDGSPRAAAMYFCRSIALFAAVMALVAVNFRRICRSLYSVTARHDYRMQELKIRSIPCALFVKERKRYVSSSVYTVNTIMGPVLMLLFAVGIFVAGKEKILELVPVPPELILRAVPFLMAAMSCMMTTTATSVSMEGKQWWITKSLPVSAKDVFDAKILLNLAVIAPFYVVSGALVLLVFSPGVMEAVWLLVLPVALMMFACVFGITVNLRLAVFDWENEVTIVKQSASGAVGGFGGCLLILLGAFPVVFVTQVSAHLMRFAVLAAVLAATAFLYRRNARTNLGTVG